MNPLIGIGLIAIMFGAIWGIGGLTFGLVMRYLGIALGHRIMFAR